MQTRPMTRAEVNNLLCGYPVPDFATRVPYLNSPAQWVDHLDKLINTNFLGMDLARTPHGNQLVRSNWRVSCPCHSPYYNDHISFR